MLRFLAIGAVLALGIAVCHPISGAVETALSKESAQSLYGGNAAPAPNNLCCKTKDACNSSPAGLKCADFGETTCTGTLPQFKEVVAENTDKNSKACLTLTKGKTCSVGSGTHICSRTYTCKWENGACSRGTEVDSTTAPDSCGDDCTP